MKRIRLYIRLLLRYLQFYAKARTRYDLHAPFAFQFTEAVLEDDREFYAFRDIELLRQGLLKNQELITINDHGAGSLVNTAAQRTVADITKHSAVSPQSGQLLFRLVQFLKPQTMLELGTSLGISAAYQASAASKADMVSIEGCPETTALARNNLDRLDLKNIRVRQGTFEKELPQILREIERLDYLYIDGDHRKGATLSYVTTCLPFLQDKSVIVLADIHWSDEMESAWKALQDHEQVSLSIDLFHFGLLFFRTEQKAKTKLNLIKAKYKPWRMGFFASPD